VRDVDPLAASKPSPQETIVGHLTLLASLALGAVPAGSTLSGPSVGEQDPEGSTLHLRYDGPAEFFDETLLLGNGGIGAALFGGIGTERIYLNDATLWAGGPVDPNMAPEAHQHLPAVRDALVAEDWELADRLVRRPQGSFSQSFAPLGTLLLEMDHSGDPQSYERTLELGSATATVRYQLGGVGYERLVFVSHPDRILAVRLEASEPGALGLTIRFSSPMPEGSASCRPCRRHGRTGG
jgi:alpha-L-fucosidase 2